jgi:glucosamine--fructose-6-phosphate aminotransferase (isomerizing)
MSQLDNFVSQVRSLSAMIGPCVDRLEPATRTALSTPEIYGLRQVILTGSGDSFFAAAAAAPMIRALTGLPAQALVSMEASRYAGGAGAARDIGARGTLVIAISYSGEAARLIEGVQRWRDRGAITLGMTASGTGRLAQTAERWVDTHIEEAAPAPGTRTYVASLIGVFLLTIRIAEALIRITMDEANALRRELAATAQALEAVDARCGPQLSELAHAWREARSFDVLGSGPSLASAAYSAAKLVEAAGVHAVAQDAEEFFHLNFFADQPEAIPTVLFAPSNAAFASRAKELADALGQLGRPTLVITDQAGFGRGRTELVLPAVRECFAPIVQTAPAALLAAYAADARGVTHYRGHDGPWAGARGAGLVRNSHIDLNRG